MVLRADAAGVQTGAADLVRGAHAVAETFSGRAQAAQLGLIDGAPGLVWMVNGKPRVVFAFTVEDGRVTGIDLLADPAPAGRDADRDRLGRTRARRQAITAGVRQAGRRGVVQVVADRGDPADRLGQVVGRAA